MLGLVAPVEDVAAYAHYRPVAAIYGRAPVFEGGPLPCFGGAGTGGFEGLHFVTSRQGYRSYVLVETETIASSAPYAPYTDLMKEVKAGFGRTMSHLPAVFGVSRQTLYNWLSGETPKEQHQGKLVQLAAASRVFVEMGFKPTALALDRTVAQGKSFVELLGEGADGKEMAQRLVRIVKRGATSREKLEALLGSRTPAQLEVSDMGHPSLNEVV
jgi:transcriptional regulator with XRE-family HTH domain